MNKKKIAPFLLASVAIIILFYWFQIRPSEIIKYCDNLAWKEAEPWKRGEIYKQSRTHYYNWKYAQCLHSLGSK